MSDDDKQDNPAAADPEEAARAAGLRYVTDDRPGITRVPHGDKVRVPQARRLCRHG
jgi:DNA topoisomerase-1